MGVEIERKFTVKTKAFKHLAEPVLYRQGYLCAEPDKVVRVRIVGDKGFLTIKGPSIGASRPEFEYEIPAEDAHKLIDTLCEKPIIEKYRYVFVYKDFTWEVDEFIGENAGLCIAEIELDSEEQHFEIPGWIGREVTADPRYYNVNLIKTPYSLWCTEE